MRTLTTLDEMARGLMAVRGSVRMGYRKGTYVCIVEFAGGAATFTNPELPIAIGAALCFLYQHNPRTVAIEPVAADPEGVRIGPAPTETQIGPGLILRHCACCGWGEEEGQVYDSQAGCPNCGHARPCSMPNDHEGDHDSSEAT